MDGIRERKRLSAEDLKHVCNPAKLGFETTSNIEPLEECIIGQERAVKAMKFGLEVNNKGYNIFIVGNPGSGRTSYAKRMVSEKAKKMPRGDDWCYVYNFKNEDQPLALRMPSPRGKEFCKLVSDFIEELKTAIPKAFEKTDYEESKSTLVKEFQEQVNTLMEELRVWAAGEGFSIKRTPSGFVNIPLVVEEEPEEPEEADNADSPKEEKENNADEKLVEKQSREMKQEEYEELSIDEQNKLQKKSEFVSSRTMEILRKARNLEKGLKDKIKELDRNICSNAIEHSIEELRDGFSDLEKVVTWINDLQEDILNNFGMFIVAASDDDQKVDFTKFKINHFVDHGESEGAPVVFETNPTYYNLIGKAEYDSKMGFLYTEFTRIIAGALHKANGGFIVMEAEEVLRNFLAWDALKRVLKTGVVRIENLGEQLGTIPISSLRPEPIEIKLKVIMVGTRWIYHLLSIYDPEFLKLFKIKVDFDVDMERNEENERKLAGFVSSFVRNDKSLPFTADAVSRVIDYSSRLADHKGRMSTQFNKLVETLIEADAWARTEESDKVLPQHVTKALKEREYRVNLIEEHIRRSFEDGQILMTLDGEEVGQINGLTVIDLREHAFGHPVRITANCFMGEDGIVQIDREVKMAGPIHNKGVLTLTGYLGKQYAHNMPLTLSATLSFEQSYGEIEGDSASSTELYTLLSALSGAKIQQGIAVTGSVNQRGEIQPIGGVNEKIEGYFSYCKTRGLTGHQGVIIPHTNVLNLMLDDEIVDAVRNGLFNIWAVSSVDEGIEILTGVSAGERDEKGEFSEGTIHNMVKRQLSQWMEEGAKLQKKLDKMHNDDEADSAPQEKEPPSHGIGDEE